MLLASFCNSSPQRVLGVVDPLPGRVDIVPFPWDDCFGVTGIARIPLVGYALGLQLAGGKSAIGILNFRFEPRVRFECQHVRDVHSLLWYDGLYAVSTGNNAVYRIEFTPLFQSMHEHLIRQFIESDRDEIHLNSVSICNDRLVVTHFGLKDEEQTWRDIQKGTAVFVDNDEVHAENLWHPHTLTLINEQLCWCESLRGTATIGKVGSIDVGGYARGLCASDRFYFVGTSRGRTKSKSTGKTVDPVKSEASICVVDRDNLDIINRVNMGHIASEIYDLVVI